MDTEWVRIIVATSLIVLGLIVLVLEFYGVFRMQYVMDRMHAAAIGDTLGVSVSLMAIMVLDGFSLTSLKLFLVVVFLWFSCPVETHLVARLEVETSPREDRYIQLETRLLHKGRRGKRWDI